MKWFVLLLVLGNALVFAWQYNRQVDQIVSEVLDSEPLPADAPPLQLLSELDQLPPPRQTDEVTTAAAPVHMEVLAHIEASDRCLDIGPFTNPLARDRMRDWLREYSAALRTRTETVQDRRVFWVYLQPTTDEGAQRSLDDLHARGVQDYMLVHRGEMKNAISLGVFRSQDSVNRRLAEMNEQGYQPLVVPRIKTSERYWLAVRLAVGEGEAVDIPTELHDESARTSELDCSML